MRNKYHFAYYFFIIIYFTFKIKCDNDENLNKNFILDAYDENGELKNTLKIVYNYEEKTFYNTDSVYSIRNAIKYFILCSEAYLDSTDEVNTILLWNTSGVHDFYSSLVYFNAFPIWLKNQKKKFCLKIEAVGWIDNVEAKICKSETITVVEQNVELIKNITYPCPDLIILGTTQLSSRYNRRETLNLNDFFSRYLKNHGQSLESKMNKYSQFDYRVDNNWLAVPLVTDFRTFRFNKTTFDYCIKKGYDLKYPPPYTEWGSNYSKTWTWEKAFEYAEMIHKCTNSPGFRILGDKSEDTKLFIVICQSLGIPFFIDDYERDIKLCGLRKDKYIEKLSIVKKLFEDHNIEEWLDINDVRNWQNNVYPKSYEQQPILNLKPTDYSNLIVNGMVFDTLSSLEFEKDVVRSYIPGSSSFLGGSGIVITSKSKFSKELYDFIEVLIDENNPYLKLLNSIISPYDNVKDLCNYTVRSNKELCNELLNEKGPIPYYYEYNGEIKVVYMRHITNTEDKGFAISAQSYINGNKAELNYLFSASKYTCGDEVDYENNIITLHEPYKIKFPISHNETIILKSMVDYKNESNKQLNINICSILNDAYNKAKPMQFPYHNFAELSNFEVKAPISLLLAHLYYKHNTTNEGSFKDIINECCDIVDKSLIPSCSNVTKIKFKIGDCKESIRKVPFEYLNCENDIGLPLDAECSYIPVTYSLGLIIQIYIATAYIIEFFCFFIILKFRNERTIIISGFKFLISIVLFSIVILSSVLFWIGQYSKFKCLLKIWTIIIGVTGFISSYSIKSYTILSVYHNKRLTTTGKSYECYIFYSIVLIIQIILLIIWSFTQNGVVMKQYYIEEIGNYELGECSIGNEYILTAMFVVDFALLVISIIMAYHGRNVPAEFNYSKKIFITSLASGLMLFFCYLIVLGNFGKNILYFSLSILIITITLIINGIFIGSKLLTLFNVKFDSAFSVLVVSNTSLFNNVNNNNSSCSTSSNSSIETSQIQ